MWVIIIFILIVFWFMLSGIEIVEENTVYIIESFGKFNRILTAGLNFRLPLFEQVADEVSLRHKNFSLVCRFPTKDQSTMEVGSNLIFAVSPTPEGVQKYTYVLAEREQSIAASIENALRTYMASQNHQDILQKKEALILHMRQNLEKQFKDWGINIIDFQITEVRLLTTFV